MMATRTRLQLTPEESADFLNSLKSLELTMKEHLLALTSAPMPRRLGDGGLQPGVKAPLTPALSHSQPQRSISRMNSILVKANGTNNNVGPARSGKVTIHVRTVFLKVGEIDTLRDRFAADAYVQAKWREPSMDHKQHLQHATIDWDQYWTPKLFIDNVFGEPKETIWHSVMFDTNGLATVVQKRRVNGSFLEYMELNQFPFDTQDLTVSLTTEREDEEIEFVEDALDRCALNVESFVDEQEWKLHKVIRTWTRTREEAFKAGNNKHPVFSAACKASRRPEFFIWNILVVMFLICTLSFATFAVGANLPQNRLQLSFILLLTTVSFKFVVNQSLPMIAYLTYLDKYILSSMAILCCICVWHAIVNVIAGTYSDSVTKTADYIALGVLGSIYIGFHLLFVIAISCVAQQNLHLNEESKESSNSENNQQGIRNLAHDESEDHGTIPEIYLNDIDSKGQRSSNMADQMTSQQAITAHH